MVYKLSQLNWNVVTSKQILLVVPPVLLGGYFLYRKYYPSLRSTIFEKDKSSVQGDDESCSLTIPNSLSLDETDKDNLDGCAFSSDHKIRSALTSASGKCAHCRAQQKLSFRETNVYESSLKNLSSGQLLKYSYDHLNNTLKALEELVVKQNVLQKSSTKDPFKAKETGHQIQRLFEELSKTCSELETVRNEYMPATYNQGDFDEDDNEFDDQASYLSSATTTSLGYYDVEPNLHFFVLYQDALQMVDQIKPPRIDRTVITQCENYQEFLAKVHCIRQAFAQLLKNVEIRNRYIKIGEDILKILLDHSLRDSNLCISAYYAFLDFIMDESNLETIERETQHRNISCVSFYDIVLDYMILESFDDLANPPTIVTSVVKNPWLSASFREVSLQSAVAALMRRKRSKLLVQDGFFAHFYSMLDNLSPVMAWGFLGTDDNLQFKCYSIKDSTQAVIADYFSFDRCRYTSLDDLCDDIVRVTEERYWELNNKLSIL